MDMAGNPSVSVVDVLTVQPRVSPVLVSFEPDMNNGNMTLTFNEPVQFEELQP